MRHPFTIVTGYMMGLKVSRRMATLFFLVIYTMKSLRSDFIPLAAFMSPMLSSDKQQQHQQHHVQKADKATTMESRPRGDCQHVVSPPPHPRINMTLRRGHLAQNLYNKYIKCGPSLLNSTRHMHPSMKNTSGVLDFTTFLSTDLKILVMGDSVAIQISQTLEEMLGVKPENRKVYRYSWGPNEGIHLSAPVRGGGVVAGWRLLGMLLRENVKRKLPNVGPGWRMEDVYNITHHTYNMSNKPGDYNYANGGKQQPELTHQVGSFDVLLFHIPIGWILDYNAINNNTLMETVLLAGELFGVETIVFNVPGFSNNIITTQQLQSLRAVQNRVIQFSNDFVPNKANTITTTTVRRVLTLRMDRLMDETMEWNARLMGMIPNNATETMTSATVNTTVSDETDWRLVSLGHPIRKGKTKFVRHVAQLCSALPSPSNPKTCTRNHFSADGMHICMETMGGRLFAGLGCVLGCVYNSNDIADDPALPTEEQCQQQSSKSSTTLVDHGEKDVLSCAKACNDHYLSLRSVENEVLNE